MKKELKVGMWCWLVNCHDNPENNGVPVEIKIIQLGRRTGNDYFIESSRPLSAWKDGLYLVKTMSCWVASNNLIPISDPDMDVGDIDVVDIGKELEHV